MVFAQGPELPRAIWRPHYRMWSSERIVREIRMSELSSFELEVARLIVESVSLDDLRPEEIAPNSPIFGEGLGLDSIDALEIALAVGQKYGVEIRSDDVDNERIFASLRALSRHIEEKRTLV